MGQAMATSQFLLYGRRHFTATGWSRHSASYGGAEDLLGQVDLATGGGSTGSDPRVFVVTGSNSGIGEEIASYLASRSARVYMVCRNAERGAAARSGILERTGAPAENVALVLADVSEREDVLRVAREITEREPNGVDGLVCNAGALLSERRSTG